MNNHNNISPQDWEQLEDYLRGTMPASELAAFKVRLDTEPALQEARLLITGIRQVTLMGKLDAFHREATEKVPSIAPKRSLRTYWMAAAAIILLVAVPALLLFRSNDDEKLAAAYFQPDPGLPTAMSAAANYAFGRGMVDYKTGNYKAAIEAWRPLIPNDPANDTLHYFSGVAFLALEKADSAAYHLRLAADNTSSTFRPDAIWYLALCQLRLGNKNEAKALLQQTDHPEKAALLSRIK